MMKDFGIEANNETEIFGRMPALRDILIFAVIALTAFGINALV